MKHLASVAVLLSLAACGYSTDEYALNHGVVASGAVIVGGPAKGINPVNGELFGAGMGAGSGAPVRSLGNPKYERYDPQRLNRSY